MAIYTFLCNSCGHEFDEITSYDPDNRPIECPHECGHTATRIPARAAEPKGAFGTTYKRPSKDRTKFNFKQSEDK